MEAQSVWDSELGTLDGVWGSRGENGWRGFSVVIKSTLQVWWQLECLMVTKKVTETSEPLLWLWLWIAPSQAPSAASSLIKQKLKKRTTIWMRVKRLCERKKEKMVEKVKQTQIQSDLGKHRTEPKAENSNFSFQRVCAATERRLLL